MRILPTQTNISLCIVLTASREERRSIVDPYELGICENNNATVQLTMGASSSALVLEVSSIRIQYMLFVPSAQLASFRKTLFSQSLSPLGL